MPDLDIIDLLDQRVYGLRAIEEIDFNELPSDEDIPPVILIHAGRIQLVLIPTIADDLLDFEVHAFGDGMRFEHEVQAYTVRLHT